MPPRIDVGLFSGPAGDEAVEPVWCSLYMRSRRVRSRERRGLRSRGYRSYERAQSVSRGGELPGRGLCRLLLVEFGKH